jgi:hypothetical protein
LVLGEYIDHNTSHRPHRALQQSPPAGRPHPPAPGANVRVLRRDRLGGLIREYSQVAYNVTGLSAPTGCLHTTARRAGPGSFCPGTNQASAIRQCRGRWLLDMSGAAFTCAGAQPGQGSSGNLSSALACILAPESARFRR